MRKRLSFLVAIFLSLTLIGCTASGNNNNNNNDNSSTNYGTLTVANVTVEEGSSATITPVFSEQSYEITYSFEGDAISITGNTVTGNTAGVVTVTATTEHHSATFTVTVTEKEVDYGTLTFNDIVDLEVGSSVVLKPKFSIADKAETVSYSFEGEDISISAGKVTAKVPNKTVTVTATTEHHSATFTVTTKEKYVDYGRLIISEIEPVKEGERVKIFVQFSDNQYADDVTFTFDSDAIEIDATYNLTALKGGYEVEITATTKYHTATFTVVTLKDYGELIISDTYAWIGYPAPDFYPYFTAPEHSGEITYSYDATALDIDPVTRKITPLKVGNHTVTATTDKHSTTFNVIVQTVDTSIDWYTPTETFTLKAKSRYNQWLDEGIEDSTTVYIGDSFFDHAEFWQDFNMTHYAGKDALCLGISATKTYHWENWAQDWMGEVKAKNVAVHIGTNNVSAGDSAENVTSSLQRLFTILHEKSPNTTYYWFSITHRANVSNNNVRDLVNANMKEWCEGRGYVKYVHTVDSFSNSNLKDGTHLYLQYYEVFVNALVEAGIEVNDLPEERMGLEMSSVGYGATSYDPETKTFYGNCDYGAPRRMAAYVMKDGKFYNGDFVASGTIYVNKTENDVGNVWGGLFVNNTPHNTWFSKEKSLPFGMMFWKHMSKVQVRGYYADVNSAYDLFAPFNKNGDEFKIVACDGKIVIEVNGVYKILQDSDNIIDTYFGIIAENGEVSVTFDFETDYEKVKAIADGYQPGKKEDVSFDKSQTIGGTGKTTLVSNGETLYRNYVLTGKIDITDCDLTQKLYPHIQIGFDVGSNRALIWDNAGNGKFKLGIPYSVSNDDVFPFTAGQTTTIEFKLAVTDDDAYFWFDGELRAVYTVIQGSSLIIGSEYATCKFYDMQAVTLKQDADAYYTAIEEFSDAILLYGDKTATEKIRV